MLFNKYGGLNMIIYGKNAVIEALKSNKTFNQIILDKGIKGSTVQEIIDLAKDKKIRIDFVKKEILEAKLKKNKQIKVNHQGVVAEIIDFKYCEIDEILNNQKNSIIIILDGIEDPHNLGAIIRTAECAGASGVIISKRRACQINETVMKTSAGALSNVLVSRVNNIPQTIDYLKHNGIWVYAVEVGGENIFKANLKGNIALVLGSEGNGISRLVKEKCDGILTIPLKGEINSLNVSVAAGISIFEVLKQN